MKKILILSILLIFVAGLAACNKSPGDKRKDSKASLKSPIAKQKIETPTLTAPKNEVPEELAKDEEAPEEVLPVEEAPKGPITESSAPSAATPDAAPSVPVAEAKKETLPGLATLPGQERAPVASPEATGEMKSIPAPEVSPDQVVPKEAQTVQFEPKVVTSKTNIEVILDSSGSMSAPFQAEAQTKFDVAKKAVSDIAYELIQNQTDFPRNIGLRVFGAKKPSSDNDCNDTELPIPISEPNLDQITKTLTDTKAQGMSPIAKALSMTLNDFPAGGEADRVVVLVADGVDNCNGKICEAAKKIETSQTKTIVHVVGFDLTSADAEALKCVSEATGGRFFLARNENELRTSLNDAVNSTVPYNLKLITRAGATPLPTTITIFTAGTQKVVRKDTSLGTKLITAKPGVYDILVEYSSSPEPKKPSKILKGVEIISTSRLEQTVNFDLGQLMLSAVGSNNSLAAAAFEITPVKDAGKKAEPTRIETGPETKSVFLSPGVYNVVANLAEQTPEGFELAEKDIEIKPGESVERSFKFQKGNVSLKGRTTQNVDIPFLFQAYKADNETTPVASGAFTVAGGLVPLSPGTYDIVAIGTDPKMVASPRTRVKGVEVKALETTSIEIKFEMGMLKISAVDGKGNKLPAEFVIRDHADNMVIARPKTSGSEPVDVPIPPGSYDIVAISLKSNLEPRPSVPVPTITVTADKPAEQVIKFILGTARVRGRNAKEQAVRTQFTMYKAGTDEVVSTAPASSDWTVFDMAPGRYDAFATSEPADASSKTSLWLRDLIVEDGKSTSHEAIFTEGKLKIIGRGPNNAIIKCRFKVFQYGSDRELINGETGDDWEIFEIEPGKYYLEAAYVDQAQSVTLKKWINISIGDNEVVEQVLRF